MYAAPLFWRGLFTSLNSVAMYINEVLYFKIPAGLGVYNYAETLHTSRPSTSAQKFVS